jgi:hypothetical protein
MATDIYSMLTGGADSSADYMKQQQAFQQRLSQATDPRAFIATVGSNMGGMLGQGLGKAIVGGEDEESKVKLILQKVSNITDPLEQAKAAYKLFSDAGMTKQAQIMMEQITKLGTRKGTGPERMIQFVGDVRRRLLQKEEVADWEITQANDYIEYLGKQKSYTDSSGRIVTVSQAQLSPLPVQGSTQAGATQDKQGMGAPGAPKVTLTPEYKEGLKRFSDSRVSAIGKFETGLNRLERIIANKEDFTTRGIIGAVAELNPSSAAYAQRSDLKTIIARTVTETLADLKAQSKTGATGFGALSAPELEIIQAAITDLDPKSKNFDANLLELKARWEKAMAKLIEAEKEFQASQGNQVAPAADGKDRPPLSSFNKGTS